jgi:hypothetical protein
MAGRVSGLWVGVVALGLLAGCVPALLEGTRPDGSAIDAMFYPGGGPLKDLLIVDGVNHFGKADVDDNDPLADVAFTAEGGGRVHAVCKASRKVQHEDQTVDRCTRYEVTDSDFAPIPAGSIFGEPVIE